ncbi:MAG: hypothetical protein CMH96_06155 [Oceanospirillaceae bacterium]|jgi:hypothetical protein|nr:hypothetical protein [Oceanospirillaceae bacterium]HCI03162.1 hypothetical protein [Oceanospirillaceae bacterium]|tara:strand:+ start:428 stop:616 length:189 start_codon:yes stop_codon:yes gene_type:complete
MIHRPNIPKIRAIQALQDTLHMQKGGFYLSPVARANEHIQNGRARRVKAADINNVYLQLEQK